MTKIVRKGVFETNSSSTHSISISENTNEDLLIVDGVINFDKMRYFITSTEGYAEVDTFEANTKNKKLVLILNVLSGGCGSEEELERDYYNNYLKVIELKEYYKIKELLNMSSISIYDEDGLFDNYDLNKLIQLIDDDSKKITHVYQSN